MHPSYPETASWYPMASKLSNWTIRLRERVDSSSVVVDSGIKYVDSRSRRQSVPLCFRSRRVPLQIRPSPPRPNLRLVSLPLPTPSSAPPSRDMPSIATSTPPACLKIKPYARPTASKPSIPTSSSFKASSVLEVYRVLPPSPPPHKAYTDQWIPATIPYPEGLSRIAFRLPNNKSITPHQWKVRPPALAKQYTEKRLMRWVGRRCMITSGGYQRDE